jgi:hypothetical protein
VAIKPLISATGEQCTFDLLNLLAVNSHQLDVSKLYSQQKETTSEEIVTIPGETMPVSVNEELLLEKATDGCTQLIHALWQLPTERSDAGPLIVLPGFSETEASPPVGKHFCWACIAIYVLSSVFDSACISKSRFIHSHLLHRKKKPNGKSLPRNEECPSTRTNGLKRFGMRAAQEWKFRHGYNKANNDSKEWPIMEVGGNDDPFEDPWERMRDAKRGRVEKIW